ncbi:MULTISPECIES: hypothetical protein [unclassified Pseudoalteromonas]|uniref:hypothetical protein n=1 Tax=unclassified Pseudoalteromonas TaxID=194690 RepID=UPI000421D793|nr:MULTISPECIES: hypothetical protein [unclassified Pseudoalteromonas]
MVLKKHANRKNLSESEFRELSEKMINSSRLFTDLEFRLRDSNKAKFVRSDRLVKFNSSIFKEIKSSAKANDSLTVSSLISDCIIPSLSVDLKLKKWKMVLFDTRSNTIIDGGKEIFSLQRPLPKIRANKLTGDERYEISEVQSIASSQINESEHLSWEPERTVCQGYVQALMAKYGYEQLVSAVKSAKKELSC